MIVSSGKLMLTDNTKKADVATNASSFRINQYAQLVVTDDTGIQQTHLDKPSLQGIIKEPCQIAEYLQLKNVIQTKLFLHFETFHYFYRNSQSALGAL